MPGGMLHRAYTIDGSGAKNTTDPATVSDFRLDKYLATVGRSHEETMLSNPRLYDSANLDAEIAQSITPVSHGAS
jgi:hypothetical protein